MQGNQPTEVEKYHSATIMSQKDPETSEIPPPQPPESPQQAAYMPPPGREVPHPPWPPQPPTRPVETNDPSKTNWWLLVGSTLALCLLFYLAFVKKTEVSVENLSIDLTPIEKKLDQLSSSLKRYVVQPATTPVASNDTALKQRIKDLEGQNRWLRKLLKAEKAKGQKVGIFNAQKYQIDRHYEMREKAIKALMNSETNVDKLLCFSTNGTDQECFRKVGNGPVTKTLL